MTPMEIALLIIGVIIFALSFFLPDQKIKKTEKQIEEEQEEIKKLMEQELDSIKLKVNEATNESVDYAVDKAERSLEKVSNEKIMAVNEYSQTIIEEINKNHQEVMFLYDMLKDKHTDLTNSVREADAKAKEIQNLSVSAANASKGLQQELTVVAVTKKGLTDEQKAVFDDVKPSAASMTKPSNAQIYSNPVAGAVTATQQNPLVQQPSVQQPVRTSHLASEALKKSIMTDMSKISSGNTEASGSVNAQTVQQKAVYDVMSGMTYTQNETGYTVAGNAPANSNVSEQNISPAESAYEPANNNRRILELHRQGKSTVDIAKELKLGVGEVKLVIDLFK